MRLSPLLALLVVALPALTAATFIESRSGQELTQGILRIEYDGQAADQLLATAILPAETGEGLLLLARVNSSATYDHYARLPPGPVPQAVILHPAGLLMGEARDATENLLVGKELIVACAAVEERVTTDATGRFRRFLPAGDCTVSAAAEGHAGAESVTVLQGRVSSLTLIVDRPVTGDSGERGLWGWLLLLLALLLLAFFWKRQAPAGKEVEAKGPAFVAEQHREALKEKEGVIVDQLLARGGSARVAALKSATRIPRTSLLRCLEGLEQRGLLLKKEENGKPVVELVKK